MPPIQIAAAGDAALLVSLPQVIDVHLNAWCVAFSEEITQRYGAAVRRCRSGSSYAQSVNGVFRIPLLVDPAWLKSASCTDVAAP